MKQELLSILRCPFCGGGLALDSTLPATCRDDELLSGVLFCECCAYPVVEGIPFLRPGSLARECLDHLHGGNARRGLLRLLRLDDARARDWADGQAHPETFSFWRGLELLGEGREGHYFLHRFSDPTYLVSARVLQAVNSAWRGSPPGRAIDVGGGTGHLTRCLTMLQCAADVVMADLEFWKLWLAKKFIVPDVQAVCCDANAPLPFRRETFSLAVCSDALNFVWQRRLLASELQQLVATDGTVVATHLHNALCENASPGMPLTPGGYRNLFRDPPARLFKESAVFEGLLGGSPVDFQSVASDEELLSEPSLFALVTTREGLFHRVEVPAPPLPQRLSVNPLYETRKDGLGRILTLRFPSDCYEAEFAQCKRYLPERVTLRAEQWANLQTGRTDEVLAALARCHVLLDLPERYV